jgi:hypothetical protein
MYLCWTAMHYCKENKQMMKEQGLGILRTAARQAGLDRHID